MRLVTVRSAEGTAAAVETTDGVRVVRDADGLAFRDVGDLLRSGPGWKDLAAKATGRPVQGLGLARPILEPRAIVCVGLNYRTHVLEMGRELPAVPTLFSKLARALTDPDVAIAMPPATTSERVDYEAELAVVIGAGGRDIPKERAWDAVAGLTLANDVTLRDWQKRSLQWFAGKSWEALTPIGPAMVTLDEVPDLGSREIVCRVNGEVRQRAPISDLIFDVPTLVADLSRVVALQPGDLILTGTTGGVGEGMKPPKYLQPGDVVEISLDGIGTLTNRFSRNA